MDGKPLAAAKARGRSGGVVARRARRFELDEHELVLLRVAVHMVDQLDELHQVVALKGGLDR